MAKKSNKQTKEDSDLVLLPAEDEAAREVLDSVSDEKVETTLTINHPFERTVSFEQYAASEGIPARHHAGMKAFIKNPSVPRTLETWSQLFKKY